MSPEQVEGEGLMLYSRKVDTWALGVIAYELLQDRMPFRLGWMNMFLSRRFNVPVRVDYLTASRGHITENTQAQSFQHQLFTTNRDAWYHRFESEPADNTPKRAIARTALKNCYRQNLR